MKKKNSDQGKNNNQTKQPRLTRRNFLKLGLGTLVTIAAIESGVIGLMYLKSQSEEIDSKGVVTAGKLENFLPGSITEFADEGFYVICTVDSELLAISSRCPHLGCSVSWFSEKNQFICPCHASSFDEFGNFESPPVPRPLDIYKIFIEDAKVLVDTSRTIVREKFETSQLTASPVSLAEVRDE